MQKKEEEKTLVLDKDYFVVMANDIIKGKQSMSLQEARLVRLMITQVVKQDKDFKTYKTTIPELARFLEIDESNMYRNIRVLCEKIMKQVIKLGTDNPKEPWQIFHWVQQARYNGEEITFKLSDEIAPFVLELNKKYSQYQLKTILTMKSYYSIRMYELLKADMGTYKYDKKTDTLKYTVKELREYFCCENKNKQIKELKTNVIEKALTEINQNQDSDIYVLYESIKRGKSIKYFIFHFMPCADAARNGLVDWGIHWQKDFEKPVQISFSGDENE